MSKKYKLSAKHRTAISRGVKRYWKAVRKIQRTTERGTRRKRSITATTARDLYRRQNLRRDRRRPDLPIVIFSGYEIAFNVTKNHPDVRSGGRFPGTVKINYEIYDALMDETVFVSDPESPEEIEATGRADMFSEVYAWARGILEMAEESELLIEPGSGPGKSPEIIIFITKICACICKCKISSD